MLLFFFIRGVGYLRYFKVKRLPNFLLASPILSVAVCSIIWYASSLREGRIFTSMFYPVGDNQSLESTSQSNCRISSETLEGTFCLKGRIFGLSLNLFCSKNIALYLYLYPFSLEDNKIQI